MPLIAITGLPGAGKSAVLRRLQELGLDAVGTDEQRLSAWRSRATRELVPDPADWHDASANAAIEYRVDRSRVAEVRRRAGDHNVFVCGFAGDEGECWDLLDLVICLVVDEATLLHRLATRRGNTYGKAEHERTQILAAHAIWESSYREHGAVIIDATQPLDDVVASILSVADSFRPQS